MQFRLLISDLHTNFQGLFRQVVLGGAGILLVGKWMGSEGKSGWRAGGMSALKSMKTALRTLKGRREGELQKRGENRFADRIGGNGDVPPPGARKACGRMEGWQKTGTR